MLIENKITVLVMFWTYLVYVITGGEQIELFFILILIGLIIIKELVQPYVTSTMRKKLNLFIFSFLLIFCFVIGIRIIPLIDIG